MKKLIIFSFVLLLVIAAVLGAVSPNGVSLAIYLLILSLVYAFCVCVIFIIIKLFYADMTVQKQRFISSICAFIPVGILALGSLSRLTFLDVFLVTTVPLVIVWYAIKRGVIK